MLSGLSLVQPPPQPSGRASQMFSHAHTLFEVHLAKCSSGSLYGWTQDPRPREPCLTSDAGRNNGLLCLEVFFFEG